MYFCSYILISSLASNHLAFSNRHFLREPKMSPTCHRTSIYFIFYFLSSFPLFIYLFICIWISPQIHTFSCHCGLWRCCKWHQYEWVILMCANRQRQSTNHSAPPRTSTLLHSWKHNSASESSQTFYISCRVLRKYFCSPLIALLYHYFQLPNCGVSCLFILPTFFYS